MWGSVRGGAHCCRLTWAVPGGCTFTLMFCLPCSGRYVDLYAKDEAKFFADFAAAFSKMLELGVEFPAAATA